jgi:hypothetical protein
MRTYRLTIVAIIAFAVVYPAISGSVLLFGRSIGMDEVYPFAPWALFCFVPNQEVDYGIRLCSVDGKRLDPPQLYEEYLGLDSSQRTIGYAMIQRLGHYANQHDTVQFQSQRQQFEQSFLNPHLRNAKYELIERRYDVLDRWNMTECANLEVVQQFDFHRESAGT